MTILSETENGKIFKCDTCNKIHIEFKNFEFLFNQNEYKFFRKYFDEFDGEYWESINSNSVYERKIIVPIGHKNVRMLLSLTELEELKFLLLHRNKLQWGRKAKINLSICNN
jgi:hypothetical protein